MEKKEKTKRISIDIQIMIKDYVNRLKEKQKDNQSDDMINQLASRLFFFKTTNRP
jgi:hypothetical protein